MQPIIIMNNKDTDHYFYRKFDDDGNIRMTKVSKGSGEIHTHMWREIFSFAEEAPVQQQKEEAVLKT